MNYDLKLNKVHEDERRSINVIDNLLKDGREFSIIKLKQDKAIGGCFHKEKEFFCVVDGNVLTTIGDEETMSHSGDSGIIPPYFPHMFLALNRDAIILEWGIKTEDKLSDQKDQKLKQLVDLLNERG